ncbi:retron St85 family RNA-directed DNA polymerase, partial [Bacillus thuringiensis]|nr:retron St85 family RNA-directed DNA polymerase [Bacillus thuringiensis]
MNNKNNVTNSFILNALNLPIIKDLESLSNHIGISEKLIYLLSVRNSEFYESFTIPKKDGTERKIESPSYSLKLVQRWILKEILEKIPVSVHSFAFNPGRNGIKDNAELHKFSLYLLQMDIKDFFTSIEYKRVFYLFKNLGYNSFISKILTEICTHEERLPQGGVCSPYISNLICYRLDNRLQGLCSSRDIIYSRYADDLTFSCDNKEALRKIKKVIEEIIFDEGFKVNHKKTRYTSPSSHKVVTGITINDQKIKVQKDLKRKVRALIHHAIVCGDFSEINTIKGYVSYINSIEVGYREKVITYINKLLMEKDYKYYNDIVESVNGNLMMKEQISMVYDEYVDDEYVDDEY